MLERSVVDSLFPADLPEPSHWEEHYPPRELPEGAYVTRFAPSPTGFVHIGGVYTAMVAKEVAHGSGGVYFVRVEDTDQARLVADAAEQFDRAFAYFGIGPDEGGDDPYGPYLQSARERIYLSYVRELMRQGRAYPCFCTREELEEITRRQRATKLPTGYYGSWARWRDADPAEVAAKLEAGEEYVVRFRSPGVEGRVGFDDAIRGHLEHEANRNDVVILKSSAQSPRLPTYHFAHAVDEHLMGVNLVLRGEEWISSVPLHLQLFEALGFPPPRYAHIAPLMKTEPGGVKRKLSKRKDPEASVDFYLDAGYPAAAVLYYLRGLANGRLAELPLEQALAEPIRLAEFGVAGPLVDMVKLADISADHIATLDGPTVLDAVSEWARQRDPELVEVLASERELAERAVDVERVGVENPRKDLVRWSDFRQLYGFFFGALFTPVTDPADERLGGLDVALVRKMAADFADNYSWSDDQPTWFNQIRELAARHGFAPNPKAYKKDPDAYPGMLRDAANVLRVALTGSPRSPDLHAVAGALGADEVARRVRALAG
ncbi:glutamate--tRNA ligase family protein [Pseudonocardia eucalypti]|uniref:Glutamate--tRNA ligase family protein n=1 Tax=Pseudonocardia eucalypti TaxID=648755 RepID=A0ABP9PSN4_9PSEU|nr:glutamyl-tRNA synthetase [Pseudonocardia eucalypti]